jgi:transcriptional regulator with XRE-family HTH domain
MYEDILAERLAQLRYYKYVSARRMSLALGQSPNYINMIEIKKSQPSMSMFFRICDYFGVTPREFFDCGDVNPRQSNKLFDEIIKLDEQSREYILGLIRSINSRPK